MNKQYEALKLALEALKNAKDGIWSSDSDIAIEACKEALKEAEKQEPAKQKVKILYEENGIQTCEILPTATWQSLSDDEINEYWHQSNNDVEGVRLGFTTQQHYFARAIEQALKEKNHG